MVGVDGEVLLAWLIWVNQTSQQQEQQQQQLNSKIWPSLRLVIRELHEIEVLGCIPVLAASPQPEDEEKTLESVPIAEEVSTPAEQEPRPLSPEVEVPEQHQAVGPEAEVQAEEELRPASPVESGMTAKRHSF